MEEVKDTSSQNQEKDTTTYIAPKPIAVKRSKFHQLIQIARNQFQAPCGSIYFKNDNGSLIKVNKSVTPNKRERARMRRKLKNENKNKLTHTIG